ncbi:MULTISPECIES: GNAT family N-acetyltransferase [Bacillaceae]|uniref:GNAT family N-acetyltransferase n=1 Tax=Bacillaceae TaxID=186817 RepID=UPI003000F9E7
MIQKINLQNGNLLQRLFSLQRSSYLIEAKLIDFYDIPPLKETIKDLVDSGEQFIGFFDEDELVGALSYTMVGQELTICRLIVDPNHFRKGIAQKLLINLEENNNEISVFKVSTGRDNFPAIRLYLKNGFKWTSDMEVAPGFFISIFEKRTHS